MRPSLAHIGAHASPVVVIDEFAGDVSTIIEVAAALAPFPRAASFYPGVRRPLSRSDDAAWRYVERTVDAVAGYVGRGFGFTTFDLLEASFSLVTCRPDDLMPLQRVPHFDSIDPGYLAILHYLGGTEGTGTAFYRQRSTGIERVTRENHAAFVAAAGPEAEAAEGYMARSDDHFEQIAVVPAMPDRLIIYQGALLHSGVITPELSFSPDPRIGRLTANLFIYGK